jgi:flavin reductase (DIM6/NTAB) family NADH-FMN oxidoreductase RutF
MKQVDYLKIAEKAMNQISKGAFLTVQAGDDLNIMTIGWASIGFMWGRPMLTIMVRKSRYTHTIIERSSEFTVSVPAVAKMTRELEFCGTESGKEKDKLKECNLRLFPAEKIKTPIIDIAGIHFECKIAYKSAIDPLYLEQSYKHLYPAKDYHTIYYGEIVFCYSIDKNEQLG